MHAKLWLTGVQEMLPPGLRCCGYPQRGTGQFKVAEKMTLDYSPLEAGDVVVDMAN